MWAAGPGLTTGPEMTRAERQWTLTESANSSQLDAGSHISVFCKASRKPVETVMKVRVENDGKPHPQPQKKSGRNPESWSPCNATQ